MEKLCIFCEHFDWEGVGYTHYSTLTGGSTEGGATCKKRHYYEERPDDEKELRELLLKAEACPDYTPPNAKVTGSPALSASPRGLPGCTSNGYTEDGVWP